jgi:hypothetical protein
MHALLEFAFPAWWILAPLIALVVTGVAMQLAVYGTTAIRRRDYLLFEDKNAPFLAQKFQLPDGESAVADARRKSISPFVREVHKKATNAQTKYFNAVVRSAGCLAFAFVAMACGTLRAEDCWAWLDWHSVEYLFNCMELVAIASVVGLYFYARWASSRWLVARVRTELMRQWQYLEDLFPSALARAPENIRTEFDIEVDRGAALVENGPINKMAERIDRFWSKRTASISSHEPTEVDLTADAVLAYIQNRVRRQLGWFADSKDRLEYIAQRRTKLLMILYFLAFVLVAAKLILFIYEEKWHHYLTPVLLVVTGMSAVMTAYYVNQNSRSLIHRYNAQGRSIEGWLISFNERFFNRLSSQKLDPGVKKNMRDQILVFEKTMIDELIDWTHITGHDAIELAP